MDGVLEGLGGVHSEIVNVFLNQIVEGLLRDRTTSIRRRGLLLWTHLRRDPSDPPELGDKSDEVSRCSPTILKLEAESSGDRAREKNEWYGGNTTCSFEG